MSVSQPSGMPSFAFLNACQNSLRAIQSLTYLSENKFRDRLRSFLLEHKKVIANYSIHGSHFKVLKKMHNSETIIRSHTYTGRLQKFQDFQMSFPLTFHATHHCCSSQNLYFFTPSLSFWRSFMDDPLNV